MPVGLGIPILLVEFQVFGAVFERQPFKHIDSLACQRDLGIKVTHLFYPGNVVSADRAL